MQPKHLSPLQKIEASGLVAMELNAATSEPTVVQASLVIASGQIRPVATAPLGSASADITDLWLRHAREAGVFAEDGSFLITPAVTVKGQELGWVRTALSEDLDVTQLVDDQGRIEFVTRSNDGRVVSGITTEEGGHWIVCEGFPHPRISAEKRRDEINGEFRSLVVSGGSLDDAVAYLRSVGDVLSSRMKFMRLLHESCGISTSSSREFVSLFDQSGEPLISRSEMETKWRQLVADCRRPLV
ncbi:hypothetical protein [Nocardia sp. NBC_01388]|uniref:hypothetical protein n=1 Tax=Nocardia sp. NBC_01388 TaxID=2903596 RepID=UPI003246D5B8